MKKVKYHELERWGWECPKCGHLHETEDDPSYDETVICENKDCDGEFIPVPG